MTLPLFVRSLMIWVLLVLSVQPSSAQIADQHCLSVDYEFPLRIADVNHEIRLDVSSDGSRLVVATEAEIILIDLESLQEFARLPRERHSTDFDISLSPDNRYLADISIHVLEPLLDNPPRQLRIWDLERLALLYTVDTVGDSVDWSPNGAYVATNNSNGGVSVWDAETGEQIATNLSIFAENVKWDWGSGRVFSSYFGATSITIWDFSNDSVSEYSIGEVLDGQIGWIDEHRELLLVGTSQIILWNVANRHIEQSYKPTLDTNTFDADWSPDGDLIAVGTREGLIFWTPSSKTNSGSVEDRSAITPPVYRIEWVLGGSAVVIADFDGGVYLYGIEAGCITNILKEPLL
jgi:WD40 repeat protein